jgi:hypothetical protein
VCAHFATAPLFPLLERAHILFTQFPSNFFPCSGRNHLLCVNKQGAAREERLFSPSASGQVSHHQQGGECFCAENLPTKGSKASLLQKLPPATTLLPGKYRILHNGNARNRENLSVLLFCCSGAGNFCYCHLTHLSLRLRYAFCVFESSESWTWKVSLRAHADLQPLLNARERRELN